MYVVLQGIGSPSCIIIKYVIPFGEQQSWMSEVRKLERFNKKTGPPKWVFQAHRRVPTLYDRCPRTTEKKLFCNEN